MRIVKPLLLIVALVFVVLQSGCQRNRIWLSSFLASPPPIKLRINTSHGLGNARGAVLDAGLSLQTDVLVTPSSEIDGRPYLNPDKFIADAQTAGATILSSSFSGWDYRFDTVLYGKMASLGLMHVYAYVPKEQQPDNVPPPAVFVTVNVIGGKTGPGIEFGLPKSYMHGRGQDSSSSGVTAQLAGLLASLKYQHPTWNWFDVKAAVRSTASNYLTGYDAANYGYGTIDYQAANRLTDSASMPLFPPAAVISVKSGNRLRFSVNSFRQSRRQVDVLYKFRLRPLVQPKELTHDALHRMGGQLLFAGDLTVAANNLSIKLVDGELAYYVWLTRDNAGVHSRIEPYSIFGPVVSSSRDNQQIFGPRLK
jgi:hypothetical protein